MRGGTRHSHRGSNLIIYFLGADDKGNVANFVETEIIII